MREVKELRVKKKLNISLLRVSRKIREQWASDREEGKEERRGSLLGGWLYPMVLFHPTRDLRTNERPCHSPKALLKEFQDMIPLWFVLWRSFRWIRTIYVGPSVRLRVSVSWLEGLLFFDWVGYNFVVGNIFASIIIFSVIKTKF